jgi:HK97 family phage major capsid protein
MTIQEMQEKRSKLLFDAHAIMSGAEVSTEQRTAVDKMLADANVLKADSERMFSLEAAEAEMRSVPGRVPQGAANAGVETETRSLDERRAATAKALRAFARGERFETRDLTVAGDGVLIPVGVADPKIALQSWGSVYDLVFKMKTSNGEPMKAPLISDVANGFVLNSTAISTTDPTIGAPTISVDDIRSNPILIDNSLIQDSSYDLIGFVEKATQDRYARTMAKWITLGNTSNVGALSAISAGVTAATTLVTAYKDLTKMLGSLDPAYTIGASWVMCNDTLANGVMNILDGNQRPIFLPFNDGGISGFAGTIFGYPVKVNPYQPVIGVGNPYIQFGNFSAAYTLREVAPGVVLKRSDQRWIELNKVGFVGFARVGGAVTDAGTHPVVSLTGK